mmetsp:Transcript_1427/g.3579  ORF Transcript_1427/g.3579 Transcript_1427/m.3579 type:complete len:258 (-) Transcript_1427:192-965(-)
MDMSEQDLAGDAETRERAGEAHSKRRRRGEAEAVRAMARRVACCSTASISRGGRRELRLSELPWRSGVLAGVLRREDEALRERARSAVKRCGPLGTVSCGCQVRPRDFERVDLRSASCQSPLPPLLLSLELDRAVRFETLRWNSSGTVTSKERADATFLMFFGLSMASRQVLSFLRISAVTSWRFCSKRIASISSVERLRLEALRWERRELTLMSGADSCAGRSEAPMFLTMPAATGREAAQADKEGSSLGFSANSS